MYNFKLWIVLNLLENQGPITNIQISQCLHKFFWLKVKFIKIFKKYDTEIKNEKNQKKNIFAVHITFDYGKKS